MRNNRNLPQEVMLARLQTEVDGRRLVVLTVEEERIYCDAIGKDYPRYFPYEGAAIFWPFISRTSSPACDRGADLVRAHRFLEEVIAVTGVSDDDRLAVLWDEASYQTICLPVSSVQEHLDELIAQPPHMYILPQDASWCACYRSEGDMGFGFAATPRQSGGPGT